ncbi:MAG: hypothetical protein V4508_06710 [Pseudomonadota bacterium]
MNLIAVTPLVLASATAAAPPLPRATPELLGMSRTRLEKWDCYFETQLAEGRLSGGVFAAARDGKLV